MFSAFKRRLYLRASILPLAIAGPALAQDATSVDATQGAARSQDAAATPVVTLPPVVAVQPPTVASPVKKRKTSTSAATTQSVPTTPSPPAPTAEAIASGAEVPPFQPALVLGAPGTLIVVDDAFVPVTVATERDVLGEGGANISDAVDQRPGISSSNFAPGASRPIIRGLDTYRVRVQENGIGSHDVSALSEDHAVPIDPFGADQVEVIRGPATLRYGSQAIGGVVAVENGRVPTYVPKNGFEGTIKGDLSSVDDGRNGAFKAKAGANGVVVHADGFQRRAEDYDTPDGTQFNSFVEAEGGAIGGSFVGRDGYIGVAISRYQSLYGIPGEEAAELMPRIDLEQDRIQARGEWRVGSYGVEAMRFWFGASDYEHSEIVDEGEGDEVGSLFTNDEIEGRFEVQHLPFMTSLGQFRGAAGIQIIDRETRGQSFEGDSLLEPAETQSIAAFLFEELDISSVLTLQAAARIEHTDIDG
ncbi:MAG: TonB-dependent receptor plug domain-containing protein, partial [Pseudomonadota bacterium]